MSDSSARVRRSPRRERSPTRNRSSRRSRSRSPVGKSLPRREISPVRVRHSSHARSPKRAEPSSPPPHSPSPRTKRLRRARGERESEKVFDKELEVNGGREREKAKRVHGERDSEKLADKEFEKNGGRDREKARRSHNERDSEKVAGKEFDKNGGREREKARRSHGERDSEKVADKEFEKNGGREREKARHKEDLQAPRERGERRSARDDIGRESSSLRRGRSPSPTNHRRRENSASPTNHQRNERSQSPSDHRHRNKNRSRSPRRTSKSGKQNEVTDSEEAEAYGDNGSLSKMKAAEEALDAKKKQQPSFELSGKLAAETNRVRGITLLFSEPPEARKPNVRWRLYVFKGGEALNEPLYIHRQSCYLFGRERRVADVPTDHPSCSKQHAVIQFRQVEREQPDGMLKKEVRPYLMDLGSTNGTFINDDRLEPQRYYELFEKDTIKFGNSSREYVMLHENSMDEG